MERHQISVVSVDKLDDVDFTRDWPGGCLTKSPPGGPDTTSTVGHVRKVENEEAMVVRFLASQTDGGTAGGVGRIENVVVINTPRRWVSALDQAALGCVVVREVVCITKSGVRSGEEVEHVEKIVSVVILELIASRLHQADDKAAAKKEGRKKHLHRDG